MVPTPCAADIDLNENSRHILKHVFRLGQCQEAGIWNAMLWSRAASDSTACTLEIISNYEAIETNSSKRYLRSPRIFLANAF